MVNILLRRTHLEMEKVYGLTYIVDYNYITLYIEFFINEFINLYRISQYIEVLKTVLWVIYHGNYNNLVLFAYRYQIKTQST